MRCVSRLLGITLLGVITSGGLFFAALDVAQARDTARPMNNAGAVEPSLKATPIERARTDAQRWLKDRKIDEATIRSTDAFWTVENTVLDLVDRLVRTAAVAEPQLAALIAVCSQPRTTPKLPATEWLASEALPGWLKANVRLYYGRWLAQERLYDEAAEQFRDLSPDGVVDPAVLLFYQSVVHHRLLEKEAGLRSLDRLLIDVADVPQRFRAVAGLMKVDLQELDDKTLDHIARRMEDIRRRLDLGRAGEKVVKVEDGVIKSLDELIEEMEKQQQQQQGGGGGSSGNTLRPSSPMKDSQAAGGKGAGEVDKKRVGNSSGWGDLPPKQREEAMQQIGKDFPAHYRDVIEQYFRKLAAEPTRKPSGK